MNRARWMAAAVLVLVFLAGAVTGAVGSRIVLRRELVRMFDVSPEDLATRAFLFRLRRELELSPTQVRAVRETLERHRPELKAIRRTIAPELAAVRRREWAELRQVMRDEQRPVFDRLVEDLERRLSRVMVGENPAEDPAERER